MPVRQIDIPPSANIASITYDDLSGDLVVQFQRPNGKPQSAYRYLQVSVQTAEGFEKADSAKKYFTQNILNQYQSEKLG